MLLSTGFLRVFDTPWLLRGTAVLEGEGPHLAMNYPLLHCLCAVGLARCLLSSASHPTVWEVGVREGGELDLQPQLCRLLPWSVHREPELASWWERVLA